MPKLESEKNIGIGNISQISVKELLEISKAKKEENWQKINDIINKVFKGVSNNGSK